MKVLYKENRKITEEFEFIINQGGELGIKVSGGSDRFVRIVFVNEELESVTHNFDENLNIRSTWHIYGAISEKINDIKDRYSAPAHG